MKPSFLLLVVFALSAPSCAFRRGTSGPQGTSYTSANLGIRERDVVQTSNMYGAGEVSGVESFQQAASVIRQAIWASAFADLGGKALDSWKSVTATKEATKATGIQSQAAVDQAKIAADAAAAQPLP